jgi:hypothetical protein
MAADRNGGDGGDEGRRELGGASIIPAGEAAGGAVLSTSAPAPCLSLPATRWLIIQVGVACKINTCIFREVKAINNLKTECSLSLPKYKRSSISVMRVRPLLYMKKCKKIIMMYLNYTRR